MKLNEIIEELKNRLKRIFNHKKVEDIPQNMSNITLKERFKRDHSNKSTEHDLIDIERLNRFIDEILKQKRSNMYYKLLRTISEKMALQMHCCDKRDDEPKTPLTPDECIKIALQFFKSIDEEFYQKAKDIVEGNSEIEFRMYKERDVKDFNELEEDGLPKFSKVACVSGNINRHVMYVPLKENIQDIFILVHELSHTFDLNRENDANNLTRNLLGEVTPSCFEALLAKYLLENEIASEYDIARIEKAKCISKYEDSVETFAKITLIEIKEKKGNITVEDIRMIQEKYRLSYDRIRVILERLLKSPDNVDFRARYMMAQLIFPYCNEEYEKNPKEFIRRLKDYFKQIKNDNLSCSLKSLGIKFDDKSLDLLISLNNKKMQNLQKSIERVDSLNR